MVVKGNLLIDQYGNILKVTEVTWDSEGRFTRYKINNVCKIVDVFGFITSEDIIQGRVRKATKQEVRTRLLLYGKK